MFAIPAMTVPGAAAQTATNRAGLVVQFPDDSTQTFCLTFDGDTISGLDLLSKSGLPLKVEAYGGLGAQICQIGPTGCDYPNQACACQSYGTNGVYWSYHHLQGDKWKASIVGAGSYQVHPGDVEGWAWSDGGPPSALYTFDQLCPAVEPTEAPTMLPTDTPAPTNTRVAVRPTATAAPLPPSPTPISEVSPTQGQPANTPTPTATATNTPVVVPTIASTATPTSSPMTAPPTSIPTVPATATATTTPTPTTNDREGTARILGIAIAVGVGVALAVWGVVMLVRRRNASGEE
ncbi:MAG TPA: hypothetical protein VLQ48_05225 [Chloroflexia bacterium]|nr:hypothetical protein [Chloroflexia bacterium]